MVLILNEIKEWLIKLKKKDKKITVKRMSTKFDR
jgi:hypothetical protein